jgi:hypothetical protein
MGLVSPSCWDDSGIEVALGLAPEMGLISPSCRCISFGVVFELSVEIVLWSGSKFDWTFIVFDVGFV